MRRDKRRQKSAVRMSFLKEEVVAPAQTELRRSLHYHGAKCETSLDHHACKDGSDDAHVRNAVDKQNFGSNKTDQLRGHRSSWYSVGQHKWLQPNAAATGSQWSSICGVMWACFG